MIIKKLKIKRKIKVFGDSHAALLGEPNLNYTLALPAYNKTCLNPNDKSVVSEFHYLGPKLAFNFSREILPFNSLKGANCIFFYLGEIDIRVHLAKQKNERFVAKRYIDEIASIRAKCGAQVGVILPPAPADFGFRDFNFPKNGTLSERLERHFGFCNELRNLSAKLNLLPTLSFDEKYGIEMTEPLNKENSEDGCHLNTNANLHLRGKLLSLVSSALMDS